MKITVAIACYNLEDRIERCLESVISQDYPDIEILVVDDCSTDRSVEVVNSVIENHPEREFRFIVNETNQGLCLVRNISIDEARGDAIFFIDGDDTIEPQTLSLFHRRMEETSVEVVRGSFRKKDFEGNTYRIKQYPEDTINGRFAFATYIEMHVKRTFEIAIWNSLYSLDFLRSHDIYCATHYRRHEAFLFTFKVILNANSISYIHEVTYNWCDYPTSILHESGKNDNFLKDFCAVVESVIDVKNDFVSCHDNQPLPVGVRFALNYVILSNGFLKEGLMSERISKAEKKQFLKWLKKIYRNNDMKWSNIVGPVNRVSYLILISLFPYSLFRFYFKFMESASDIIDRLSKSKKKIS